MTFILAAVPYAASPTTLRRNCATNPSCEAGVTHWSYAAGTGGVVVATRETSGGVSGSSFYRAKWTTGGPVSWAGVICAGTAIAPNTTYTLSMWVRSSIAQTFTLLIGFGGGPIALGGANFAMNAGVWTRIWLTATSGAADTSVDLYGFATSGAVFPVNATIDGDAVLIETGSVLGDYFDGDTPSVGLVGKRHSWEGAPNASASVLTARTPLSPLTPDDVLAPYTAERVSTTILHEIIGRVDLVPALGPLGLRKGTLDVWCNSLAQADAVVALYAAGNVVMFRDSERPSLDMYHVATSVHVAQADVTARWVVTVAYAEVYGSAGAW